MYKDISIDFTDPNLVQGTSLSVTTRKAVRGIIRDGTAFLLIHSPIEAYYDFAGGGVEEGEDPPLALRREILEETGYSVDRIGPQIMRIVERQPARAIQGAIFLMENLYYECSVDKNPGKQSLSEKEITQGIIGVWTVLEDAIAENRTYLAKNGTNAAPWVTRALRSMEEYRVFMQRNL